MLNRIFYAVHEIFHLVWSVSLVNAYKIACTVVVNMTISLNYSLTYRYSHRINGFSDFVHHPGSKELEDKIMTFQKLDLFPSSGDGGTPTLLCPLERANPNHWTQFPKCRVFIF
jgi:hypothetical protein